MIRSSQDSRAAPVAHGALTRRAGAEVGVSEEIAGQVVASFLRGLKDALLQGERVDLDGLVDLGVVVDPARIQRDATGRFSEIAPASSRLDVRVGRELRDRLATQRAAGILLAMRPAGAFGEILAEHFARLGWEATWAETAEACLELLDGPRPYMLVCDHALPGRDELVAQVKTNWRTNRIPVVTLHTRFDDLKHPERVLVLGDLAVFEPISVHPFLRSMDQILAQASEEAAVFERQFHFRFPAREEEILRAFDLSDGFFKDAGFRGDGLVGLTTAFRETVRNAELHGSREDPGLGIDVEMLLDREKLTLTVEDEGEGFDHRAYLEQLESTAPVAAARQRHGSGGIGGLGIYLMRRCADRLEYNDRGNRVTLMKYREEGE